MFWFAFHCCDNNAMTKSYQRKKEFILPHGSRGLESIMVGNALYGNGSRKLANHVLSIVSNQRERAQGVEPGYKTSKP